MHRHPRPDQEKDFAGWCRANVILHHPFRQVDSLDLITFGGEEPFADYEEAHAYYIEHHSHQSNSLGNLRTADLPSSDKTLSEVERENPHIQEDERMALRIPNHGDSEPIQTNLERYPKDMDHNWLRRTFTINISQTTEHILTIHGSFNEQTDPPSYLDQTGNPGSLNTKQSVVFDQVLNLYH